MKTFLKSILILSLIIASTCVCNSQDVIPLDGDYNTYDINVEKTIEVPDTFTITYITNTLPLNDKEVMLTGTVDVNRKYKIIQLDIEYFVFDGDLKTAMVAGLELKPVAGNPGRFSFDYAYPLDLSRYEYEIFSLIFIVEEIETQIL